MERAATWMLYFVMYSFLGWICETVYCSAFAKRFINRGFLSGPVCPIYGVGALFLIGALQPYEASVAVVFALGMLATSVLEYVTGWLMEALFHNKWWDYSTRLCNINGRVCLGNSILFGVLSVAVVFVIHPVVEYLVKSLPDAAKIGFALVFAVYFIVDLWITVNTVLRLNERLARLSQLKDELKARFREYDWKEDERLLEMLDKLRANKSGAVLAVQEKVRELQEGNHVLQQRILNAFPNLKSHKYGEHLADIKRIIEEKRNAFREKK